MKDAAGNISTSASDQVVIELPDVTKPVITAFSLPAASSSLNVDVTGFTATDNKAVSGYIISESATAPLASNSGWTASAPVSYTFATEGTKTLYAWAKDAAGNISASANAQVNITLPVVINEVSVGNNEVYSKTLKWANRLAMPVTFTKAGEIKSISIYHDGGTGNFLLGVYSDKSGYPSALIGVTATTTVSSKPGWQTVQLTIPVSVKAGQKVWLSWVFQYCPALHYTSGNPGRAASSGVWKNGMPASFGTSTIAPNKYSIYCSFVENQNITKDASLDEVIENESIELISNEDNITADRNLSIENSINSSEINGFKLYPNPASSFVNVDFEFMPAGETTIEIHDISGKKVYSQSAQQLNNRLDINNLKPGIYFIRSTSGNKADAKKLIVK